MEDPATGQIAPSTGDREQLAKDWLVRMIDRTPLREVGDLPIVWLSSEAPPLINAILDTLADPSSAELAPPARERAARLARIRTGAGASAQIPRDLAALQSLLVETLRRELPEREPGEFARAVRRLAEVFGSIQGAVARELVEERSGGAAADPGTGLPGTVQLEEWLRILLAEQRRYGHGFALAVIDVDGLARINDAYGREAGDRMLAALAAILRLQLRDVDQTFRLEEDEFAILAPHTEATGMAAIATRVAGLIAESQSPAGPRIAVAIGVVDCPGDGLRADSLLEAAAEAVYAAKAAGVAVARSQKASDTLLQDP